MCSQLKIIIFRSYFDSGLPRSRSTSRMVSGRFLFARCLTARSTAALVLLFIAAAATAAAVVVVVLGFACFGTAVVVVPGTVKCVAAPAAELLLAVQSEGTTTAAATADGVSSNLSKLNSLCDKRSMARYVVNNLRRM